MKECQACKILVNTERKTCPLCFTILKPAQEETKEFNPYPKYQSKVVKYNYYYRGIVFLSIIAILTSVIVNIITYKENKNLWSLVVIAGISYFWILLRSTIHGEGNIPRRLLTQMLMLALLLFIIDYFNDFLRWSINYVIPFLSISLTLSIISLLVGNTGKFKDYVSALFASIISGFIPFVLWLFKIVKILWPSLGAATLSLVTIIGMFIFAGNQIKEELKKRFHI